MSEKVRNHKMERVRKDEKQEQQRFVRYYLPCELQTTDSDISKTTENSKESIEVVDSAQADSELDEALDGQRALLHRRAHKDLSRNPIHNLIIKLI